MKQCKEDRSTSLTKNIKEYIDLKLEYFRLAFAERTSLLVGNVIFFLLIALLGLAGLLVIIVLIYNLLMCWIGIDWVVSLIELGLVILIAALLFIFKESLVVRPIANLIVHMIIDPSGNFNIKEDDEIEEE